MLTSLMIANRQTWFGNETINQLIPLLKANPQPTLLFSCRSFLNGAVYASLEQALAPLLAGIEIVSNEAAPQEIDAWVAQWRGRVQRVVAIGGGSVLDAAKAFAAMVEHPLPTLRYLEKIGDSSVSGATLPLIAIPTTAGTGSEVTQNAVVTDTQQHKVKASLRHPISCRRSRSWIRNCCKARRIRCCPIAPLTPLPICSNLICQKPPAACRAKCHWQASATFSMPGRH